jgi:Membrane protein involved in the export of O-antigen and teichoic acid
VSLRSKVFKAGNWVLIGYFIAQIIRLGGNLVLTRLLVPEMFGLMAVVSVFLAGIAMFSDLGIQQNIIQSKRGTERAYINTAWTVQILRGGLMFLFILILSASLYYFRESGLFAEGSVYLDPQLPWILAVMSLTGLISGFNSLNLALLSRDLKLNRIVYIEVISQVLGLVVMIVLAWYQRDVWSLVIGAIASSVMKMVLSHDPRLGHKSRCEWEPAALKDILHFGKWIFGASIFTFLMGQGDRLLLGGLISPNELGVYTIAFFLAMAFKTVVRKLMSSVLYPALSEVVRNRPSDLKKVYYQIRGRLDVVVMIVIGLLASSGHLIIDFLYDDRYKEAGWMLEMLSLSTVFLGISMAGVVFMALGDSKYIMVLTAFSAVFLFISVPIAYQFYGLYGAVIAISLNSIIEVPLIFYRMRHYKLLSLKAEFRFWPVFFLVFWLGKVVLAKLY